MILGAGVGQHTRSPLETNRAERESAWEQNREGERKGTRERERERRGGERGT